MQLPRATERIAKTAKGLVRSLGVANGFDRVTPWERPLAHRYINGIPRSLLELYAARAARRGHAGFHETSLRAK